MAMRPGLRNNSEEHSMYSGIIQTSITKRLPLELEYRKPSEGTTGDGRAPLAFDGNKNHGDDPLEIEFYRLLDLI